MKGGHKNSKTVDAREGTFPGMMDRAVVEGECSEVAPSPFWTVTIIGQAWEK